MFDGKMLTDKLHAIGWKDCTVQSTTDEAGSYTHWTIYRDNKPIGEFQTGYSIDDLTELAIAVILGVQLTSKRINRATLTTINEMLK